MAQGGDRDRVEHEVSKTNDKIVGADEKLAIRFREKSRNADDKAQSAEKKGKQEALRRRSELFAEAAKDLEDKVAKLRKSGG